MNNWERTTLGDIAQNVSRRFNFSNNEEVVFVNTGDVLEGKFLHSKYSNKKGLPGQAKKGIQEGDILFSEIRPANKRFALVDFDSKDYVVSTKFMVIRGTEKVDPEFLYKVLSSRKTLEEFQTIAESRSGTFPQITFDSIVHYPILLPSLLEQKKIVRILSSLDDKIELLRRQNGTLEKIAQTIFKQWFVDFNFPDKNGKPYKESGGKMVEAEMGEIPEGWIVGKYSDLVQVLTGKGIRKEALRNHGLYKVLGANGEIGRTDEYLFAEDLILTGRVGTLGTIYISRDRAWISDNVLISRPKTKENFYFAYFNLKRVNFDGLNRGSTQPLITQTDLKNVEVIVPDQKVLTRWHVISSGLFDKIHLNSFQIQTFTHLRDTLLPKLMSGAIRVGLYR